MLDTLTSSGRPSTASARNNETQPQNACRWHPLPANWDAVGYQDSVVVAKASTAPPSPSSSTRACPWRPKA
jgi:hypothetical protein